MWSTARAVEQRCPERLAVVVALGSLLLLGTYLARFGTGPSDEGQQRRGGGFGDPDRLDLYEEEARGPADRLVQPRDRANVLGPRFANHPDRGPRVEGREVGDQLPEVVMVG